MKHEHAMALAVAEAIVQKRPMTSLAYSDGTPVIPTPVYSGDCGDLGARVDYFRSPEAAHVFLRAHPAPGGHVKESSPGLLWRATRPW